MGKKKTTNVTKTGLGDQQFQDLTAGQNTLMAGQTTLGENQAAIGAGIDNLSADVNTGFTDLSAANTANTDSILAGQTGIQDFMTTQANNFTTQLDAANEARAQAEAQAAAAAQAQAQAAQAQAQALAGLQGTTDTGFADMRQGFSNVDERFQQAATARRDFANAATDHRQRIF